MLVTFLFSKYPFACMRKAHEYPVSHITKGEGSPSNFSL